MRRLIFTLFVSLLLAGCGSKALRVCADPNSLPFSNDRGEGFENKIAELLAREWGVPLEYTWWAQRRGFIRNTLGAKSCDVVMGVPAGYEIALTTVPYYRSGYAFAFRRNAGYRIDSFDSPLLRTLRVGVQLIGDDGSNTPPAHELARMGVILNVRGYSVLGDYGQPNPPARIIDAVASQEIDVAIAWGPMAGYFAQRQAPALEVVPIRERLYTFAISVGVRREEHKLKQRIESFLVRRRKDIDVILDAYGVPRL